MKIPKAIQNFLPAALIVGAMAGLWCVFKSIKERVL